MRTHIIGTGVLLGVVAATLAAPAALAEPATPYPPPSPPPEPASLYNSDGGQAGQDIAVWMRCYGTITQPESPAFRLVGEMRRVYEPTDIPTYLAPANITPGTPPGSYPIHASCDGESLYSSFNVYPSPMSPPAPEPPGMHIIGDGSPQAGESIGVVVRCWGEVGQPQSPILSLGKLKEVDTPADIPTYQASATIEAGTAPGDYPVTATCDGEKLSTTFTVYPPAKREGPTGGSQDNDQRQVTRTPRGAPDTGDGPGPDHSAALLAGGAGLAALAGLGTVVVRRRTRP